MINKQYRNGLLRINLPYATFGIVVENGFVREAAPMGKWMIGKHINMIIKWVEKKGGKVEAINE